MYYNPKTQDRADFGVTIIKPEGDKVARMIACQNLFEAGVIWAPAEISNNNEFLFKDFVEKVMAECEVMPKGEHDDLADAMSQGLLHLRLLGLAKLPDEWEIDERDPVYERGPVPLYPAFA